MANRDHAAALAQIDAGATIPHDLANALYRAGVEMRRCDRDATTIGTGEFGAAFRAFDAALAAVADKLTKGEGK